MARKSEYFENTKDALAYAQKQGYKLGQTRLYKHVNAGLVYRAPGERRIRITDFVAYLAQHGDPGELSSTVTGEESKAELDRQAQIKKNKKLDLQIQEIELANRKEDVKWISRGDSDRNLISFAVLLDAQFDQQINTKSQQLVALVGGDDAKRGEFVAMLREIKDAVFNTVAQGDEIEVDL